MRVLLVQHAAMNTESYPLGLSIVAAILQATGHEVRFLDLALRKGDSVEHLVATAEEARAEALGFTLMTPQYGEYLRMAARFRPRLSGMPVIAGGPHVAAVPEETLREGAIDIAATGEAEAIAAPLFAALGSKADLASVPGIVYRDAGGTFHRTQDPDLVSDLDHGPPIPWELFHPDRYRGRLRGLRQANILASRGCPFHCLYCRRGPASGRRFRPRAIDAIVSEIRHLQERYGIRGFAFVDDIFTFDMERAAQLCQALAALPRPIRWICETRADRVDGALLAAMKRAGCVSVDFGVESGSEEILLRLRKRISKDAVRRAFAHCRRIGLPTRGFFMLGTPWENEETIAETIAFARELRPTTSLFFLAMPYPGTELRDAFVEAGWPLPRSYDDYLHWVEGRGFRAQAATDRGRRGGHPVAGGNGPDPRAYFAAACRRATRAVVWSQISRPQYYPELLSAYLTRYSLKELAGRVIVRGLRLCGARSGS